MDTTQAQLGSAQAASSTERLQSWSRSSAGPNFKEYVEGQRRAHLEIERDFGQLRKYMDQAPFKSRGALVLFTFSEIAINAPKAFIARFAGRIDSVVDHCGGGCLRGCWRRWWTDARGSFRQPRLLQCHSGHADRPSDRRQCAPGISLNGI